MGFDLSELIGGIQDSATKAFDDIKKTGVPALQVAVETQASQWLDKQKAQTQQTLNQNVKDVLAEPSQPGSFGAAFKNTIQSSVFQNYGPQILLGIGALIFVGFFLGE